MASQAAKKKVVAKKVSKSSARRTAVTDETLEAERKRSKKEPVYTKEVKGVSYAKGLPPPVSIPGMDVSETLNTIERKIGAGSSGLSRNEKRMSTGMLALDILYGGGITAGWYTNFGKEQSSKTTGALTVLASALTQGIPIMSLWDYEGSSGNSYDYIENILKTMGIKASVSEIFGVKDKDGKYIIKPRVRYQDVGTAEPFFDYLAALERRLPDKIYEGGSWWYAYEDNKENRKHLSDAKTDFDAKRSKGSGKLYVQAEDGRLQALILTDSYPAMLPERLDTDDPKAGLAAVARMFSEQLPRVKPKLRRKRICVLGVNQLRDIPMAMYGPKEQEPAGQAIRYYSDVRMQFSSRAISAVRWAKQFEGQLEQEKSINGGLDTYRYIHVKGHKNKLSPPGLSTYLRLWVADEDGQAHGYDPVFDTFQFMHETGLISSKKREKILLKVPGNEAERTIGWTTFKKLILGTKDQMREIYEALGMKPMLLRPWCFKQIASGKGLELYFEQKNKKDDEDDEEGAEADDLSDKG